MTKELEREFGRGIFLDETVHTSHGRERLLMEGKLLDFDDLAMMDQSGWRALSQNQGWSQPFMESLAQLAHHWLRGSDRKELLALARSPAQNHRDFRPAELFRRWLDKERLGRLHMLTADFGETRSVAHYYALSHALRAILTAVDYTAAVQSTSWEIAARSSIAEDNERNPEPAALSEDVSSWLE